MVKTQISDLIHYLAALGEPVWGVGAQNNPTQANACAYFLFLPV